MSHYQKLVLFLMRLGIGTVFFYAGITKVLNSDWSAAGYLGGAKTFSGFYTWLASSGNIGWVNMLNEWGLTLIGAAMIVGFMVKYAAPLGALMMLLYYFPGLDFPKVGTNAFLVDEHIMYILVFGVAKLFDTGKYWGLDKLRKK